MKPCTWTRGKDGLWRSGCGKASANDGAMRNGHMAFAPHCPGCGRKIKREEK